jgi:5-methyltetrahydrofolate--homocysteine methyltransferase
MWREQDFIHPRALLGYFPCNADGNELVIFDPEDQDKELTRFVNPRQPKNDRICLSDFFRPLSERGASKTSPRAAGERDVVALQAVTVGAEATEYGEKLEQEGEYSERYFVHGLSVQAAEGTAEWLHQKVRADLGIGAHQGRRYSWGYPAIPEQAEHEKLDQLLNIEQIGITLSGGHALSPEQSTVAIIAHHPQAVYFGTTAGRIPEDESPDEVIALSDKGGPLPDTDTALPDEDPEEVPA